MRKKITSIALAIMVSLSMGLFIIPDVHASDIDINLMPNTTSTYDMGTSRPGYTTVYYKIQPLYSGSISFTGVTGNVQLTNVGKVPVSENVNVISTAGTYLKYANFGVQAGTTYYVKVTPASYDLYNGHYYLNAIYQNYSSRGSYGTSKSSASKMSKSTKRYGYLPATGFNNEKWYKFTTNQKTFTLYFDAITDNALHVAMYTKVKGGKTQLNTLDMTRSSVYAQSLRLYTHTKKTKTVYLKVYPNYMSSGEYQIYWK
jgi:hypothetical protein